MTLIEDGSNGLRSRHSREVQYPRLTDPARQLCIDISVGLHALADPSMELEGFIVLGEPVSATIPQDTRPLIAPIYWDPDGVINEQKPNQLYFFDKERKQPWTPLTLQGTTYTYEENGETMTIPSCRNIVNWAYSKQGGLAMMPWDTMQLGYAVHSGVLRIDGFADMVLQFQRNPEKFLQGKYIQIPPVVSETGFTNDLIPMPVTHPDAQQILRQMPLAPFEGIDPSTQLRDHRLLFARFMYYLAHTHDVSQAEEGVLIINTILSGLSRAAGITVSPILGDERRKEALHQYYTAQGRGIITETE